MQSMEIVNNMLASIPLPLMTRARQRFDSTHISDVASATVQALRAENALQAVEPGMRIAVTAGSRGIANIDLILRTVVGQLRRAGASPFIVPAMGSHGGATAEGQLEVLRGYGITEEAMGCPIHSSMDTLLVGATADGRPVRIDAHAARADGIVAVNRVKAHTSFTGPCESGLMKMLAVGLAKQAGADACHREGHGCMAENILKYGNAVLAHANILFGLAVVENAYDQTRELLAIPGPEIPAREPGILCRAKSYMPGILFSDLHVLVVDRMGKNISGLGMDPHITGSFATRHASGPPRPDKLVVLDLTDDTHGNATGMGVADITTRRLVEKLDLDASYANAFTATITQSVRIPVVMHNQKLAIQAAIKTAAGFDKARTRMVRIPDTLHLSEIWISGELLPEARQHPQIDLLGPLEEMRFDRQGNLF